MMNCRVDWANVTIGELVEFKYGKSLTKKLRLGGDTPVYGSNGIVGWHSESLTQSPCLIVGRKGAAGEVHFSSSSCWPIDTTYYIDWFGDLEPSYLLHLLIFLRLGQLDTSTAIPGLNRDDAYRQKVSLPPLIEQRAIVAKIESLFSELDQGVEQLQTVRQQLKRYRQSVLKAAFEGKLTTAWRQEQQAAGTLPTAQDLLTQIKTERQNRYQQQVEQWETSDKKGKKPVKLKALKPFSEDIERFPDLPESWLYHSLENITSEMRLGKMLDKTKNKGEFKPYLRNANVRWFGFDLSNLLEMRFEPDEESKYGLKDGDLVICEGGEPGRCSVWRGEAKSMMIQKAIHRVRFLDMYNADFAALFLKFAADINLLDSYFTGTTIKHLTGLGLKRVPFPVSSILEQELIVSEIESRFSVLDELEKAVDLGLKQAESLRQSILKKAFEGRLLNETELATVREDPAYEPAEKLLERIRAEREPVSTAQPGRRRKKNK